MHVILQLLSCARGATASGGVTFMRAFSSLIPNTCFIAITHHICFALPAFFWSPGCQESIV